MCPSGPNRSRSRIWEGGPSRAAVRKGSLRRAMDESVRTRVRPRLRESPLLGTVRAATLVAEAGVPASEPVQEGADIRRSERSRQYRTGHRQSQRRAGNHRLLFHRHRRRPFRRRRLRSGCGPADCGLPQRDAVQRWRRGIGNLHVHLIAAHRRHRVTGIHQPGRRVPDDHAPGRAPGHPADDRSIRTRPIRSTSPISPMAADGRLRSFW